MVRLSVLQNSLNCDFGGSGIRKRSWWWSMPRRGILSVTWCWSITSSAIGQLSKSSKMSATIALRVNELEVLKIPHDYDWLS